MNLYEALECVEKEKLKYNKELRANITDEIIGNSVIYGSTMSSVYLLKIFLDYDNVDYLLYATGFLIASLISLKNHNKYARSDEEKKLLKELISLEKRIIKGENPLENIEKEQFNNYLVKKL